MNKSVHHFMRLVSGLFLTCASCSLFAEPQLYETGPSEESSYVRFVNASEKSITVVSSNGSAKIELSAQSRSSRFFPVKAGSKLNANIQTEGKKIAAQVTGKAWEYITIAVLPDATGQIKSVLIRETPEDFNATRSSLALFNLDEKCSLATMQGGAKNVAILEDAKPFSVKRRLVNPVKLAATVVCAGQSGDSSVDLSQLQAGERYSIFLIPSKNARHAFFVRDSN
jgi:hypothetical protein